IPPRHWACSLPYRQPAGGESSVVAKARDANITDFHIPRNTLPVRSSPPSTRSKRVPGSETVSAPTPTPVGKARLAPACSNPVIVSVTGAAGQIGYALLFRIASGQLLGRAAKGVAL